MSKTHCATYTKSIERKIIELLGDRPGIGFDPFAGEGKSLPAFGQPPPAERYFIGWELEAPWADQTPNVHQGDSTRAAEEFPPGFFDFIVTSPCYGNRFADHHTPRNGEAPDARRGYTYDIRRLTEDPTYTLDENNAGLYAFGTEKYARLHEAVYAACTVVAKDDAEFILNVKNFQRDHGMVDVVRWHVLTLEHLGWGVAARHHVQTPNMGRGQNGKARADGEWVFQLRRAA